MNTKGKVLEWLRYLHDREKSGEKKAEKWDMKILMIYHHARRQLIREISYRIKRDG